MATFRLGARDHTESAAWCERRFREGWMEVIRGTCVLCDRPLRPGLAHSDPAVGFCASCAGELGIVPTEDVLQLSPDDVDRLPFGFITLDRDGTTQGYNAFEASLSGRTSARALGRSFFRDVAPCTAVREFEGRYREMVARGEPGVERFRFAFRFAGGEKLVQITMTYIPDHQKGVLVVRGLERT
ncbi:MAG TPA: PAS domain-containing protein [Longimicrobium sp.]|nr:PAS domain-containing protein [Longimicrobium sp.]